MKCKIPKNYQNIKYKKKYTYCKGSQRGEQRFGLTFFDHNLSTTNDLLSEHWTKAYLCVMVGARQRQEQLYASLVFLLKLTYRVCN